MCFQVILEAIMEPAIGAMPYKIFAEKFISQEVVHSVFGTILRGIMLTENVRANATQEKTVSILTHFLEKYYLFIIILD